MRVVGLRELKNRLSQYVRDVRAGQAILVTDRGEVVAELRPPGAAAPPTDVPPGALALIQSGLMRPGAANQPALYPALPRGLQTATAAQLLDQERGQA